MPSSAPSPVSAFGRVAAVVAVIVAVVVPLSALRDVHIYGVDVPIGDQWSIAPMFDRLDAGSRAPHGLFGQANESRPAVPRLFFLALARLGRWDVTREMYATQGLLILTSLGLALLSRRLGASRIQTALALAVATLALFSSAQYANFLWGIQFIVYVPFACLVWLSVIAAGPASNPSAFGAAAGLCAVATYSYANGMLLWPLAGFVLFATRGASRRTIAPWLLLALSGAASLALYFRGYQHPGGHPGLGVALRAPADAVLSVLAFIGSSLSFEGRLQVRPFWIAAVAGGVVVAMLAVLCAAAFRARADGRLVRAAGTWACLAAYGLGSAVLTVVGRLGFGREYMLVSRYVAFSSTTLAAAAFLTGVVWAHWRNEGRTRQVAALSHVASALAAAYLVLWGLSAWECRAHLNEWRRTRLQARALLPFVDVARDDDVRMVITAAGPAGVGTQWRRLVARGLLEDLTPSFEDAGAGSGGGCGEVESLREVGGGQYEAAGWTYIPGAARAGDAVLVASQGAGGRAPVSAVVPRFGRADIVERTREPGAFMSGWAVRFAAPGDGGGVEFWTLDGNARSACRLERPSKPPDS